MDTGSRFLARTFQENAKKKGRVKARPGGTFETAQVSLTHFGGALLCGLAAGAAGLVPVEPLGLAPGDLGVPGAGAGTPDWAL